MPEADLNEFLYRTGLAERGSSPQWTSLSGGVSSDIWRVDLPAGPICIKRALPKLRVASDWQAPIERNDYEWEWFDFVHRRHPELVPRPLAHDAELKMLAMEYLDPARYRVWKSDLLDGRTDADFAAAVGRSLARIHAESTADKTVPAKFATDRLFFALRIEPYLLATARRHRHLAPHIERIAKETLETKRALAHGDVSPKNILIGDVGPVFLDAETAWFGDPAFDLAFCLNHLLLKSVHRPRTAAGYNACFRALAGRYLEAVNWEPPDEIERRAAALLPILLLARVDGKSPVEYLSVESEKEAVREKARSMIARNAANLTEIAESWAG